MLKIEDVSAVVKEFLGSFAGLLKKLAAPQMCMADVRICQCMLMTYA
jgi:hypothetical protein